MVQTKVSLTESLASFADEFGEHGYKDKSSLVRDALERLRKSLEESAVEESARLYAEIYDEDEDLQELTESASRNWPDD